MNLPWLGFDWYLAFYPAIQAVLQGENPYVGHAIIVANPPWTFWLLAPLGLLSPEAGFIAVNLINITGLFALFYKHQRPWLALPAAISFPFVALLLWGNIDGLGLWGLALGGPFGLILLSVKPQLASLVALLWLREAWIKGGIKAILRLTAPLLFVTVLMTILYPNWIGQILSLSVRNELYLANGFPWFVPAGLALIIAALRQKREELAALASVLLSPHVHIQSWIGTLILFMVRYPVEGIALALFSWIPFLIILT